MDRQACLSYLHAIRVYASMFDSVGKMHMLSDIYKDYKDRHNLTLLHQQI